MKIPFLCKPYLTQFHPRKLYPLVYLTSTPFVQTQPFVPPSLPFPLIKRTYEYMNNILHYIFTSIIPTINVAVLLLCKYLFKHSFHFFTKQLWISHWRSFASMTSHLSPRYAYLSFIRRLHKILSIQPKSQQLFFFFIYIRKCNYDLDQFSIWFYSFP